MQQVITHVEYRRLGYYDASDTWVATSNAWTDLWHRIPGISGELVNYNDGTARDHRTVVYLRDNVLCAKSNEGYYTNVTLQMGDGGGYTTTEYTPSPEITLNSGELLIYRILNGTVYETGTEVSFTGFTISNSLDAQGHTVMSISDGYVDNLTINSAQTNDPFDTCTWLDVRTEPGQYEIRVRRSNAQNATDKDIDRCMWVTLDEFGTSWYPVMPPVPLAMTAIKIKATNQLNGSLEGVTATVASRQPIYVDGAWATPTANQERNNPASLFIYVLKHHGNALPVDDSKIDWSAIEAWSVFCADKGFIYENILTGQRPMRDVLADIAAAGRASIAMPDGAQ